MSQLRLQASVGLGERSATGLGDEREQRECYRDDPPQQHGVGMHRAEEEKPLSALRWTPPFMVTVII